MKLGLGIVTEGKRPLEPLLASALALHPYRTLVVRGGTDDSQQPDDIRQEWAYALSKHWGKPVYGIRSWVNSLPLLRDCAERSLAEMGCDQFLIADDDMVFLPSLVDAALYAIGGPLEFGDPKNTVIGGGVLNGWEEGNTMSEMEYLEWLHSDTVTPGGHVVAGAAVYPKKFCGLWWEVYQNLEDPSGVAPGEDLAWNYLVYKRDGLFQHVGYAALHLPPEPPRCYDGFTAFKKFREKWDREHE